MDSQPATIGRYEIRAFIARGGMGTVYLGWDPVLQRQVAIKLLREGDNEELRTRFTREARSAANLRHRNIVTIFDVGDHQGQPFMAMEYIHGQTLGAIVASEPPPSTVRRLQFVEDLCDGLAYAHKRGVVHRDIKPANLMVDSEGTLKILDFGIARAMAESGMTQAGLLVGSLNYMSPEQVAGSPIDTRSDIFAVGAVMYELMTRRPAFPGSIDSGVLNRILSVEPEPIETLCPHLDPAIGRIVRRAIHKSPSERYGDLLQMRSEIAQVRRTLEDSVLPEDDVTIAVVQQQTTRVTPTPRRGADRDEIARRRAQQIEEHVTAARQSLADGAYDEAIGRCEQALLLDPNESRALDIAERARLQRDEASAREWLAKAQQHLKAGDLSSASNCVREALTLIPESSDAIEMRRIIGEARLAQERERQRQASIQAALDRGREALDRADPEGSIAAADEALGLAPAHTAALELKERAQQAIVARERARRDEEANRTAAEARELFAAGQHAEALGVLEQFWPAHPVVSHAWAELSAEAARIESEREAALARAAAEPGDDEERTVFVPRTDDLDDRTVLRPLPPKDPVRPVMERPETSAAPPPFVPPTPPAGATARPATPPPPTPPPAAKPPATPPRAQPHARAAAAPASKRAEPAAPSRGKWYLLAAAAVILLAVAAFVLLRGPAAPEPELTNARGNGGGNASGGGAPEPPVTSVPTTTPPQPQPTPPETTAPPEQGGAGAGTGTARAGRGATGPETAARGRSGTPPTGGGGGTSPVRATTTVPVTTVNAPPPATTTVPTTIPPATTTVPPSTTTVEPVQTPITVARGNTPSPPPPIVPKVNEEELIERTINAFAQAYRTLDVPGVLRVYPSLDRAQLTRGFSQLDSQEMRISGLQVNVNGSRATVRCRVFQRANPKAGRATTVDESTEFQLEKRNGTWVILTRRAA